MTRRPPLKRHHRARSAPIRWWDRHIGYVFIGVIGLNVLLFPTLLLVPTQVMLTPERPVPFDERLAPALALVVLAGLVGGAAASGTAGARAIRGLSLALLGAISVVVGAECIDGFAQWRSFSRPGMVRSDRLFRLDDVHDGIRHGLPYATLRWTAPPQPTVTISDALLRQFRAERTARRDRSGDRLRGDRLCVRLPVESISDQARLAERQPRYVDAGQVMICPADDAITYRWPPQR